MLTLASALHEMFGVQLYKNNARALLSRILSILNLDWLQHARSVRRVYECQLCPFVTGRQHALSRFVLQAVECQFVGEASNFWREPSTENTSNLNLSSHTVLCHSDSVLEKQVWKRPAYNLSAIEAVSVRLEYPQDGGSVCCCYDYQPLGFKVIKFTSYLLFLQFNLVSLRFPKVVTTPVFEFGSPMSDRWFLLTWDSWLVWYNCSRLFEPML